MGRAVRNEVVSAAAVEWVAEPARVPEVPAVAASSELWLGVVGREALAEKLGRSREVRDGEGGRGVGGRL